MSEYIGRFFQRLKGLNLPPDVLPLGDQALREYLELTNKVHKLEDENAYLQEFKDDFFQRAFCASLTGLRAATTISEDTIKLMESAHVVKVAIADAQEAVRQVGELNKEKSNE